MPDEIVKSLNKLAESIDKADFGMEKKNPVPSAKLMRHELEQRAYLKLKNSYDLALEYHRAADYYAQGSIRLSLIFNGGALLVLMNFVIAMIRSGRGIEDKLAEQIGVAFIIYVFGAFLAIIASATSYFGSVFGTREKAFKANESVYDQRVSGYREITEKPKVKKFSGKEGDYIKRNSLYATITRYVVITAMLSAYGFFICGTVIANNTLFLILNGMSEQSVAVGDQTPVTSEYMVYIPKNLK